MREDSKGTGRSFYAAEIVIMALGACGMWLLGEIRQLPSDRLLGNCVMTVLGLAVTGFHFRREYADGALDYNNAEHVGRYWLCMGIGLLAAFVCAFLPAGGWPFLPVFVMLSLFSNLGTGVLSSSVLLLTAVLLSGAQSGSFEGIYALYLVSGVFAATLFRHLENDFKVGIPLFLSLLCLLVCETANLVLVANARPDFELFVIPIVNIIISSVLLLGLLKLFFSMVIYHDREKYLDINDVENPMLVQLRQEHREKYMNCIHTAYFCERLARQLDLDVDALKSAAYYHWMEEETEQEKQFPTAVREIMCDYRGRRHGIQRRETAVLLCADTVVESVTYVLGQGKDKQVDYDRVIDLVFERLSEGGTFDGCDISVKELHDMQKVFKEEKLYYDFLH